MTFGCQIAQPLNYLRSLLGSECPAGNRYVDERKSQRGLLRMSVSDAVLSLIRRVDSRRIPGFSGMGLIVYDNLVHLPCLPMAEQEKYEGMDEVAGLLAEYSRRQDVHHDGFHLLDRHLRLTHAAQYIAPPIAERLLWQPETPVGARTMTALLASCVQGVVLTASVSSNHSVRLFRAGACVFEAIDGMADV